MNRSFPRADHLAGMLISLIGLVALLQGRSYGIGTLGAAGPGFFPVVVGVVMVAIGILIALSRYAAEKDEAEVSIDWRGGSAILLGVLVFIIAGEYLGLAPATFACVLISALGDRTATIRSALILAAAVTVGGVALFSYALQLPFPLFR